MPFDQASLERYAMQAEKVSQEAPPLSPGVEIDAVGKALGFSREESREIAVGMQQEGWATLNFAPTNPLLSLTVPGYREIAKLRWPRWRRWLDKHPAAFASIVAVGCNLLIELAKYLLR